MSTIKLEKLLLELLKLRKKNDDNKALLKSYKIKSDRLTQLTAAKKDIHAQMEEEKNRIEDELLEDNDYAEAKKSDKELRIKIKEQNSDIRMMLDEVNKTTMHAEYDYNLEGEPLKMQMERAVLFFLNGKEQK